MLASCTVLLSLVALGSGDGPVLYERGRDGATGVLVNCTAGCESGARPDPARPTVVFVHGSNPFLGRIHYTMAERLGEAVGRRYGAALNVLGWDWNGDTVVSVRMKNNARHAAGQGVALAEALHGCGVDPARLHLVGQSAGCIVAASAARCLTSWTGRPVAQLTMLDPAGCHHGLIFGEIAAGSAAGLVEHYWVPGLTGFGRPAPYTGVWNCRIDPATPAGLKGVVRPLESDHVHSVAWYIETVERPEPGRGFGNCRFVRR